jgi:hypothetical protein
MHHYRLAGAILAVVAAAAYGSTIDNYFVQDDFGVVWLLSQKPAGYFPRWFVTPWMDDIWGFVPDEVRPFVAVSYQLAAAFGPSSPIPNHLLNIAFHAGAALLVVGIARQAAGCGTAASVAAGLVFVVLPNQAESVAWITGRVDSMPALFYMAAFLTYVRWRAGRGGRQYFWSLAWCFAALFSKQNTVTLVPALVLYDTVALRRPFAVSWDGMRPYLPYAAITAAYLLLRYELFGEAARESLLTADRLVGFAEGATNHVVRIVFGTVPLGRPALWAVAFAALTFVAARLILARRAAADRPGAAPQALYFGVVWTLLGLAPTVMATYSSPRHAYLASAGWTIAVGIAFDVLWRGAPATAMLRRTWVVDLARSAAVAAAAALLGAYTAQLRTAVVDWNTRAALSSRAVAELEREVLAAPGGTLIIAGVPQRIWEFALPFAAQPPFTRSDLTSRVAIISESSLHCCPPDQWDAFTRQRLREWAARPDDPPVIALYWDPDTGRLLRLSDREDPSLRGLMKLLLGTGDGAALNTNLRRLLAEFVASHSRAAGQPIDR